jgi:hypothetical protein
VTKKPIIFNGEMVRAILNGRKTQTRRIIKYGTPFFDDKPILKCCPFGKVGDCLWVRETFADIRGMGFDDPKNTSRQLSYSYRADCDSESLRCAADYGVKWKPSIHMPCKVSRILLEITNIRIERVQDISSEDVQAEGFNKHTKDGQLFKYGLEEWPWTRYNQCAALAFEDLWTSIYGEHSIDNNPWVWVIEFKRVYSAEGSSSDGQ